MRIKWVIIGIGVLLLILVLTHHYGIFLSPRSLRLRSLYRQYEVAGLTAFLREIKLQNRRQIEIAKGIAYVAVVTALGLILSVLHSRLLQGINLRTTGSMIRTIWQVHAVIIGFSFVALSFAWEQIYSNSLSDKLTRIFIEDIGSIWTVTFVFGASLVIGITVFSQSSTNSVDAKATLIIGSLFVSSLAFVTSRFLKTLEILFYTDINEELKQYAMNDLERDIIRERSKPDALLMENVPQFKPYNFAFSGLFSEEQSVSAKEVGEIGIITDIHMGRMRNIAEIVDRYSEATIQQNPTIGQSLAEETTVFAVKGEIAEESVEEIRQHLRHGIKTRNKE